MSAYETLIDKINAKTRELEEKRKEFMKELQQDFVPITKEFFNEVPLVQAVVWTQYTPYFNDGDECVFSVHEPNFVVSGFDPDELESPYEYEDDEKYRTLSTGNWIEDIARYREYKNADWAKSSIEKLEQNIKDYPGYDAKITAFADFLQSNEELLNDLYGDHVAVYLTEDNVVVEEYDHD